MCMGVWVCINECAFVSMGVDVCVSVVCVCVEGCGGVVYQCMYVGVYECVKVCVTEFVCECVGEV